MARAHGQAGEPELLQDPFNLALGELDAEASLDLRLKVDTAPAHDAVHGHIRPLLDQLRQIGPLRRSKPRRPS